MQVFDATSRSLCTLRRIRTNTPLQAFVTLNDPVYVEAAQALARRIVREGGETTRERARYGLELCLGAPAEDEAVETLVRLVLEERVSAGSDLEAARALASDPLGPLAEDEDPILCAAWTVASNVLLNLDAVLTLR